MNEQGIVVKAIAGFYYVYVAGSGIYECRGRGILREKQVKPMVGDRVRIAATGGTGSGNMPEGALEEVLPRKNQLVRPPVSNVDQALIVFAMADPKPTWLLLDTYLAALEREGIPSVICFNKCDLVGVKADKEAGESSPKAAEALHYAQVYRSCGYPVFFTNARSGEGVDALEAALRGKTSVCVGTSGVGKSSLANRMQSSVRMETGEVSRKLLRGKNTTRHCELMVLDGGGFLVDAPGFSSFELPEMPPEELAACFPEFREHDGRCYFRSCVHDAEPDCAVKEAVEAGTVDRGRYENYRILLLRLKEAEKQKYR